MVFIIYLLMIIAILNIVSIIYNIICYKLLNVFFKKNEDKLIQGIMYGTLKGIKVYNLYLYILIKALMKSKKVRNGAKSYIRSSIRKTLVKIKKFILFISILDLFIAILCISIASSLNQLYTSMNTVASLSSLMTDEVIDGIEGSDAWDWEWDDIEDGIEPEQEEIVTPGIYPVDSVLRNWALYFEYCENATAQVGSFYAPWALVGTMLRETGATTCPKFNDASFDISKDLNNIWAAPNDMINSTSLVKADIANGGAVGMYQFDPGTFMKNCMLYGSTSHTAITMDTAFGFVRPNAWYSPDIIQSGALYAGNYLTFIKSDQTKMLGILNDNEFLSLDLVDQQFIYGFLTETHHNYGSLYEDRVADAYTLIQIAKNKTGGITHLYDMCDVANIVAFKTPSRTVGTVGQVSQPSFDSIFGFGSKYTASYIEAMCGGYQAYYNIKAQIDAAEKEKGSSGNGTGGTATGQYAIELNDGAYYWYHQSGGTGKCNCVYCGTWSNMNWGANGNYNCFGSNGCAVYAMAIIISNLTNTEVTPIDVLTSLESKFNQSGNTLICTTNSKYFDVREIKREEAWKKLAEVYGLNVVAVPRDSSSAIIDGYLNSGYYGYHMWGGKFAWYNGSGHFMGIRKEQDGLYYCFTSIDASGQYGGGKTGATINMNTGEEWSTIQSNLTGAKNKTSFYFIGN